MTTQHELSKGGGIVSILFLNYQLDQQKINRYDVKVHPRCPGCYNACSTPGDWSLQYWFPIVGFCSICSGVVVGGVSVGKTLKPL